jgi:hypothetical protein
MNGLDGGCLQLRVSTLGAPRANSSASFSLRGMHWPLPERRRPRWGRLDAEEGMSPPPAAELCRKSRPCSRRRQRAWQVPRCDAGARGHRG